VAGLRPPPVLDPAAGDWIFDSTVLINCLDGTLAGHLTVKFARRAHLADEVLAEIQRGPAGKAYARVNWFTKESLELERHLDEFRQLRLRWGSVPGADRGEAASIILANEFHWIFATDDGTAFATAQRRGICVTRTPQLVLAMVRAGWLPAVDGWEAIRSMQRAGSHLGELPWGTREQFEILGDQPNFDTC